MFWVFFAFNVKAFECCSHVKCQGRSWISLSIWAASEAVPMLRVSLCPWQVDVTAQVGIACTWVTLLVMSSRSVLICGCLGQPSPTPLQLARPRFAAPSPALKVLLLWVHLYDKFWWLQVYLLLKFIPLWSASPAVTFPDLFNWKLHSRCLNLQKQTRRNYLERLLRELFFLYIFQIFIQKVGCKWKNRSWFGLKYQPQTVKDPFPLCLSEYKSMFLSWNILKYFLFLF